MLPGNLERAHSTGGRFAQLIVWPFSDERAQRFTSAPPSHLSPLAAADNPNLGHSVPLGCLWPLMGAKRVAAALHDCCAKTCAQQPRRFCAAPTGVSGDFRCSSESLASAAPCCWASSGFQSIPVGRRLAASSSCSLNQAQVGSGLARGSGVRCCVGVVRSSFGGLSLSYLSSSRNRRKDPPRWSSCYPMAQDTRRQTVRRDWLKFKPKDRELIVHCPRAASLSIETGLENYHQGKRSVRACRDDQASDANLPLGSFAGRELKSVSSCALDCCWARHDLLLLRLFRVSTALSI